MRKKVVIGFIAALLIVSCLMTSCSGDSSKATVDQASPVTETVKETTVIIETVAGGGTVEKDSEGNKITKDDKGAVIAVEDKEGNSLVVSEYLKTHSYVEYSVAPDKSTDNPSNTHPDSGKDKSSTSGSEGSTSSAGDNDSEGEVPVIIATLPDDDELKNVPDL